MAWDIGLLITISICAGFAFEVFGNRDRQALLAVPLLAGAVIFWCGGELLLRHASDPDAALWARRLLYAGLCAVGPVWLWTATRLHAGPRPRFVRELLIGGIAIELVVYSSLYWAPELLSVGSAENPQRGPLFTVHAITEWTLIVVAIGLVTATAARLEGAGRVAAGFVLAGVLLPLFANWMYLGLGMPAADPTPILVGLSAVVIRWAVLDLVAVPYLAAHARTELLEQMDGGVLVADGSGIVVEANRAARALLGAEEPIGRPIHQVVAPFDHDLGVEVRRFPLHRHHVVIGAGVLLTDRREARAAEQRAEASSRLEGLGVLAAGLAHEVNHPLAIILGGTAVLMEEIREPHRIDMHELRHWVARIDMGAERIADVVRQMGDLASFDENERNAEICDGLAIFRRAIALSRFGKEPGDVLLDARDGDTWVAARATDLTQILLYLLVGSLRASQGIEPVEALIEGDADERVFRVLDRSTVLPEDPSRIFDPFHTGGGRIGLSLAWELARQNGGQLEARARPGGGAEFRLSLPAASPPIGDAS